MMTVDKILSMRFRAFVDGMIVMMLIDRILENITGNVYITIFSISVLILLCWHYINEKDKVKKEFIKNETGRS